MPYWSRLRYSASEKIFEGSPSFMGGLAALRIGISIYAAYPVRSIAGIHAATCVPGDTRRRAMRGEIPAKRVIPRDSAQKMHIPECSGIPRRLTQRSSHFQASHITPGMKPSRITPTAPADISSVRTILQKPGVLRLLQNSHIIESAGMTSRLS